jgi:hypothetical protein
MDSFTSKHDPLLECVSPPAILTVSSAGLLT